MSTLPQSPCPADNLTTYTSPASYPYVLYCNINFRYSDLPPASSATLASCISACDTYTPNATVANGAACIAASFGNPAYVTPNCYLKFQLQSADVVYDPGLYSARRVGYEINEAPIIGMLGSLGPDPSTALAGFTSVGAVIGTSISGGTSEMGPSTSGETSGVAAATGLPSTTSPISSSSSISSLPTAVSSSESTSASSGVSSGAKIGIGVGVALAIALLFALLIFFLLRRRKRDSGIRLRKRATGLAGNQKGGHELVGQDAPELRGDEYAAELDGKVVEGNKFKGRFPGYGSRT